MFDFTPVWVDMGFALQQLTNLFEDSSASDYVLTLSQSEGAVNVVWTSLTTNNVSQFLTTAALGNAETVQLTEEETRRLLGSLISSMLENRTKGIFLFEGRALENDYYYETKYIMLRCYRKSYAPGKSTHLFELKLPISVSPVEDMFRWIDERWVCGDTNNIPSRTGLPWNNPGNECDGREECLERSTRVIPATNVVISFASERNLTSLEKSRVPFTERYTETSSSSGRRMESNGFLSSTT